MKKLLVLGCLLNASWCCSAQLPKAPAAPPIQTLSPVAMRGYGTVSGTLRSFSKNESVLQLLCESVAKAQLLHAKYVSDLGVLPGIKNIALSSGVTAFEVEKGIVAALRDGKSVFIISAKDRGALHSRLQSTLKARLRAVESRPSVKVPMWLDRWDKFGFRFYYRPWVVPNAGEGDTRHYDITKEFEWARQQGRSGLVFWDELNAVDSAEGMMGHTFWDWGEAWAKAKELPVGINAIIAFGAPKWIVDRYRNENAVRMPQYVGNMHKVADAGMGGMGVTSWSAGHAKDVELGLLQTSIRRWAKDANVTTFLEPHGELRHGAHNLLLEYGQVADIGYRRFLQQKYKTLAALGKRWHDDSKYFGAWNAVRVPEIAAFAGWGSQALDLQGAWRVGYEEADTAPDTWMAPDFDDSSWPLVVAPGHDRSMLLPKKPAVFRRTFTVPAAWKAKNAHVWLYVWDLNEGIGNKVSASLNGQNIGDSTIRHADLHRAAFDVSSALRAGDNHLALRLPQGFLAYRVYLSPDEPKQYPNLGAGLNAQWADFTDWTEWSHAGAVRRGMEMIRQVDANRSIVMMAPDAFGGSVKTLAEDYGGEWHDTGIMGVIYADALPMLARGSGLPSSVEPAGPAGNLPDFQRHIGRFLSEGVQGLDYFIHLGNIFWPDDIRKYFEANRRVIQLLGKFHAPSAQTAILLSNRIDNLSGFPWGALLNSNDPNALLRGGYWNWNAGAHLRDRFERDGLSEQDFARGNAAKYRVVVDSNTSIMDEALLRGIEKYVREGGTFVTLAQSGRHSSTKMNAWPIQKLSGYRVTHIDRLNADGSPQQMRRLKLAPNQKVFGAADQALWHDLPANGLSLQSTAPDTHDLLLWDDGSVAAGYRQLGKGFIVQLGAKWSGERISDRIDPGGNNRETQALTQVLTRLLQWRNVRPIPAHLSEHSAPDGPILLRHYISNNGLHDVWTLWNQSDSQRLSTDLVFDGAKPSFATDVQSGASLAVTQSTLNARLTVALEPLQTRAFLTPRGSLGTASLDWFNLQRAWWRASKAPRPIKLPALEPSLSRDMGQDWAWKPLTTSDNPEQLAAPNFDDKSWAHRALDIWNTPQHSGVKHALFRRSFTVPAAWKNGRVELWLQSWYLSTFADRGRIWLDGKVVKDWSPDGLSGADFNGALTPGSTHNLAVEIEGQSTLNGSRGSCWLYFVPKAPTSLDLAGTWTPSRDALHDMTPINLPGDFDALTLRRTVAIPAAQRGQNAVLSVECNWPLVGVIINGHLTRRHHHRIGERWTLNITPWVRFGAPNEIELIAWDSPGRGTLRGVRLDFFKPDAAP